MAARKSKAKTKTKPATKAQKTRASPARKAATKRPRRDEQAKAPLAEMDAAWQSLLETAIERHRANDAQTDRKPKAARK